MENSNLEKQEVVPMLEGNLPFNVDTKIEDCENSSLFNFLWIHFNNIFQSIEELKQFINFLLSKKKDNTIEFLLKNFNDLLKEFKNN